MSKLNCSNCKYYDFNAGDGVDWCKLNHEETGICGNCDREFEDLEEAITYYDAIVEENNTFLIENSKMAGELKDLQKQLAIAEKALELACKELGNVEVFDKEFMECESFYDYFKTKAKGMLKSE